VVDEALLEADPGRQLQGPGAALLAKIARTAMRASSLRRSARWCVKAVRSRWGRDEPSCRTASPAALKPWITLRTVWSSQPSWRAITGARSPRAEASKIWQRRNTKASDERNPAWTWRCSSSVKGRIKMGVLILGSIPHCLAPLVDLH
jgi:hypothetical protein